MGFDNAELHLIHQAIGRCLFLGAPTSIEAWASNLLPAGRKSSPIDVDGHDETVL